MRIFLTKSKSSVGMSIINYVFLFLSLITFSNVYGDGYYGGQEFQVNTYTASNQQNSSVAKLISGNFVVTWNSNGQDGDVRGIYAQIFDGSGNRVGGEFQVNTYTVAHQQLPSVAILSNGNFVIVWAGQGTGGSGFHGQIFSGSGTKIGDEFLVTNNGQGDSSIAALISGGNFVVTWRGQSDGSSEGVHAQIFDGSGTKVGGEIAVNTYTNLNQISSSIVTLSSGNFVIVWYGEGVGDTHGIYGQIFNSSGTKVGSEFLVNTYTLYEQGMPSIAELSNGNFVVTWDSENQDGSNYGVYGQIFNSSGAKVGSEFQVNTYTTSYQRIPSIAALNGGNFIVVWQSSGQDGSDYGIYGQLFDESGTKIGSEFLINAATDGQQCGSSVVALSDGNFVVIWESGDQDGDGKGVYGKIFEYIENLAPTIGKVTKYGTKNSILYFKKTDFSSVFEDADGHNMDQIQITSLPNNGVLKLTSGPVAIGQEILASDIDDSLVFDPDENWTGTTTFGWKGRDGIDYSDTKEVTINIESTWLETWWPVITGGAIAAIGVPFAIVGIVSGGLILKKCKQCCFKKGDDKTDKKDIVLEEGPDLKEDV